MSVLGPNGENVLNDPLKVRMDLISDTQDEVKSFKKDFEKQSGAFVANAAGATGLGQGGMVAAVGGLTAAAVGIGLALAPFTAGLSLLAGAAIAVGAGAIAAGAVYAATAEDFSKSAESAGGFAAKTAIALQTQQEMLDSLQLDYEKRIEIAKATGDMAEAARLESEYLDYRNELMLEGANTVKSIQDTFAASSDPATILKQYETMTLDVYKDDPLMTGILKGMEADLSALDDEKEIIIRAGLLSEDLSPTTVDNLLNSENSEKEIDLLIKLGSTGYSQVDAIAAMFGDETVSVTANAEDARTGKTTQVSAAQKFKDNMALMDPAEALAYAESFNPVISTFSSMGTEGLAAGMSIYLENPELLENANKEIAEFKEKTEGKPITLDIVQEVYGQDMVDKIKENQAYFDSLPEEDKVTYTTILKMIGDMDPVAKQIMAIDFAKSGKGAAAFEAMTGYTYDEYSKLSSSQQFMGSAASVAIRGFENNFAQDRTEAGNTKEEEENKTETPTPSKGPKKKDPYEDLLRDLKRVRNSTIDVTGGLKELQRVLGKGMNMKVLGGVESKLLESPDKISAPLASYFASLDAETQKLYFKVGKDGKMVLTQAGKLWRQAFDERAIGDVYVGLQGSLKTLKQQSSATKTLASYGLDWATATELAGDAELAAAIASGKNVEEIQKIVKLKKEELSLTRQTAAVNKIQENFAEGASLAQLAGFSLEEQKVISATQELQNLLKDGKGRDDATFRQLLAQEIAKTVYERQVAATNALKQAIDDFKKSRNLEATIRSQLPQLGSVQVQTILNDPELMQAYKDGGSVLSQAFYDRLRQLMADPANLAKIFEAGLSNAFSAFDIQEKAVELKFQQDTKQFTDVEDGIIPKAERRIALIEDQVDDYEYMLETISSKEQEINEKYEARYKALELIQQVNQRLIDQQQSQLDIAGALSRGDISAAASAVQAYRAKVAQTQMENQKQALDLAKEKELSALTSEYNGKILTRKQIEKEVKDLKKQILEIQEKEIEPAEKSLRLATDARDIAISNVSVLGLQRAEWEQIQNNVDKASINNAAFVTSLTAALSVTEALKKGPVNLS
jgi:DNA polymerase III delta prime subunit